MTTTARNEAAELWEEYDTLAYFVGAAYAYPPEEARLAELKALILAAERRATVERIRERMEAEYTVLYGRGVCLSLLSQVLDEEAARP